jgi:hypothetical protein
MNLLGSDELPGRFVYPDEFLKLVQSDVLDIGPWQFLEGPWLRVRLEGLRKRYPDRGLIPFARRLDNDDVACWDQKKSTSVYIVHDFSAPGWEDRAEYTSFQSWYLAAREEASDYDA